MKGPQKSHSTELRLMATAWLAALALGLAGCGEDAEEMEHAPPDEAAGQTCVVCHACGGDGTSSQAAPTVGVTHAICSGCHKPDGTVQHHGSGWTKDCSANPPTASCGDCHSVKVANDACLACH